QQEVVAGAEARVLQQQVGALALAARQALLHVPDLPQRQGEALGNGGAPALLADHVVGGLLQRRDRRHGARLQGGATGRNGRREQGGEQEGRSHRLAQADAFVGVGQRLADQRAGVFGV